MSESQAAKLLEQMVLLNSLLQQIIRIEQVKADSGASMAVVALAGAQ